MAAEPGARIFGLDAGPAPPLAGVLVAHVTSTYRDLAGVAVPSSLLNAGQGVELFFALSGFLIGGRLLDIVDRRPDVHAWWRFMVRRWLRTVPLYLLCLVLLLVLWPPGRQARPVVLEYFVFAQNFAWPMPSWFGVSWSLTVEEWFYVLFSALALASFWVIGRRAIIVACAVFIVVPIFLRFAFGPDGGNLDGMMRKVVIYRLDAIAYGVVVVWWCRTWPEMAARWRWVALGLGLVLFAISFLPLFSRRDPVVFAVMLSAISAGFALMLPAAASWKAGPRFGGAAVRWLAGRSYCIYLIHLSLLGAAARGVRNGTLDPVVAIALALLVTAILAEASWRWFETPILRLRPRQFAPPPEPERPAGAEAARPS